MESQFFDWEGWDQADTMIFQFYKCKLKVEVGSHQIGEVIPCIFMDYEKSQMVFSDNKGGEEIFNLKLTIV